MNDSSCDAVAQLQIQLLWVLHFVSLWNTAVCVQLFCKYMRLMVCECVCVYMCVSSMSSCLFLFACHKVQVTWQAADAAPAVVEMLKLTCLFPWAHEAHTNTHTIKTLPTHKLPTTSIFNWNKLNLKQNLAQNLTENWSTCRMRNVRLALACSSTYLGAALGNCLHNYYLQFVKVYVQYELSPYIVSIA